MTRKTERAAAAAFYEEAWRSEAGDLAGARDPDARKRLEIDAEARRSLEPLRGRRVLEIGPGGGGNALALSASGARVVALDIAPTSLVRVRQRAAAHGAKVLVVVGDAERLPFRGDVFDRAALFSILMFTDPDRSLSETARVLSRGGLAAVVEAVAGNVALSAWRRWAGRYGAVARWKTAEVIMRSARHHFLVRAACPAYALAPVALLPEGRLRRLGMIVDGWVCRLLPGQAWQLRLELEKLCNDSGGFDSAR